MLKTVYKANIDIIHIQRDETSSLFSVSERISAGADSQFGSESQADNPMAIDAVSLLCCSVRRAMQMPICNGMLFRINTSLLCKSKPQVFAQI